MKLQSNRALTVLGAFIATLSLSTNAAADSDARSAVEPEKKWVVDHRGAPPFKRRLIDRNEQTNNARPDLEPSYANAGFRRSPPFKRQRPALDARNDAVFARLEEVSGESRTPPERRGPPGKMNTIR